MGRRSFRSAILNPDETSTFRDYGANVRPTVREFYRLNHRYQSVDFVLAKERQYLAKDQRTMGIWEAMEFLNTLVDDSDPDTDLTQIEHLMQTAEAIRADGHPRLVHPDRADPRPWQDPLPLRRAAMGRRRRHVPRRLPLFREDRLLRALRRTIPTGTIPGYQTECGIYEPGCGLDHVHLSWGHDEYLYHVVKDYLPEEGLAMIRYHSFYAAHREGAYTHLMNDDDRRRMEWVRKFNPLRPVFQGPRTARRGCASALL